MSDAELLEHPEPTRSDEVVARVQQEIDAAVMAALYAWRDDMCRRMFLEGTKCR